MDDAENVNLDRRHADARNLATELLGACDDIVHQPYGHSGITFEIRSPCGDYILKTTERQGAYANIGRHIDVLKGLGVVTPSLCRWGSYLELDYALLTRIPGRDLGSVLAEMTREQMARLAAEVVRIERKVTGLPEGKGFGWTPIDVPGPFPSWTAVIDRDAGVSPAQVREEVAEWRSYFDSIRPMCFLDDLTVKNVIVRDGEFQGIVDVDEVCYGDPLYWLSLAEVTVILDVGTSGAFYGEELRRQWGMSEQSSAACDLYNTIQAWFFLSKGAGQDPLAQWAAARFERARAFRRRQTGVAEP